jgi:hypothetical protein
MSSVSFTSKMEPDLWGDGTFIFITLDGSYFQAVCICYNQQLRSRSNLGKKVLSQFSKYVHIVMWVLFAVFTELQHSIVLFQATMAELSPFVYWAQTENNISLKVDLRDVKVILLQMD